MNKTMEALKNETFRSSCECTDQWRDFARTFKLEMKKMVKGHAKAIDISRGHFYMSGFVESNTGKIIYFSISDVRYSKQDKMLVRTATSFKDYHGGSNGYITFDNDFKRNFLEFLNS